MSEIDKWCSEFWPSLRKIVIGTAITGVIASAVTFSTGAWENIVNLWRLPERVEANHTAIERLRVPAKLFEISERSGPVNGFCVEGEPCEMNVRLRRLKEALACQIVPGSVQYYYRNPRNNEIFDAPMLEGTPRNVGTAYINLPFTFGTPRGLVPDAELCVEPEYTGCPGQMPGGAPAKQSPECFNVSVIKPLAND